MRNVPKNRAGRRGMLLSRVRRSREALGKTAANALIVPVRAYQILLSPFLPRTCRFTPTCSSYMIEALRKRGPVVGLALGLWRICRCNPFCKGGYDPVRPRNKK